MTTRLAPSMLGYRMDGPEGAPPIVLGPSLGTSLAVWDPQVPALAQRHRVVRWDLPGHGISPAALLPSMAPGAATVGDLGRLVLGLADALGLRRFAYAGISLGGAVGTWLAVHHPERLSSLVLVCSSARFGTPETWHERAALVRAKGTGPLVEAATARWFTPAFVRAPAAEALAADLRATDPEGYAACCDALAVYDLRDELARVSVPALVVAGREDPATPPGHARELADGIPGASLVEVGHAAHLASVERPGPVLAALLAHLSDDAAGHPVPAAVTDRPRDDGSRHAEGMAVRRAVLGDDYVDRAVARTTEFTAPFQDFITRYAWGEVWTRPGLSRYTRSCVTMTALVAHGHLDELALHVRAALRNGLTPADVQEVLLQTAVYCGVPAANAAFAVAGRVLHEAAERPDAPPERPGPQ
ncbi:3-oxoadipate enol-lactonase [Sphaerisporangium melleum]|uniref:3-oxoadipate enol-lactonase n=1 Tax=Sphaerisporangium melleum TaxID=321316 RepID=A0A917RF64_9ACTN|nr:3-oxoadipate enol-lactonase [Sphaerisporangium melleum]GGL04692.1 3-oxoadipate enol-lactonase [Sphaerisporangium melleum]GII74093.1 3-oxoadipate enol-lactonase [Sphaerisporangium melleum]